VQRKKNLQLPGAASAAARPERRLAILASSWTVTTCSALTQTTDWLERCDQVRPEDLMELHRHNLSQ
jgi:16S rRNA (cytosine967-C5)-methyltransferase